MLAQCQCGQLSAKLPGPTDQNVVCHCIDCQRRSGSPFGQIAYYAASEVELSGTASHFTRATAAGNTFTNYFCPSCGSTVWCVASRMPSAVGITIGAIADPDYPGPARSVWEQSMHHWLVMPQSVARFPQGRT